MRNSRASPERGEKWLQELRNPCGENGHKPRRYIHRLDMQDGQPDNATTGWEPALQNSQYFSMTGYHWRIWVPLLVIVSLFAAVACVGEDNIETTAKPILTPRSLPSPVPAVPTPTPGPIQVPTPRPSPTPAVSADSNNSTVEVAGKLVQAPVPTSTPAPTAVPPPTVLPTSEPTPETTSEGMPKLFHPMADDINGGYTMSMGVIFACALQFDGKPLCWNYTKEVEPIAPDIPPYDGLPAAPPQGESFVSITGGTFQFCGLREGGTPVCWLAIADPALPELIPPAQGERFSFIDSRTCYTCGLRSDGTPLCWEQIRDQTLCDDYKLAEPPAGEKFVALTGGDGFSCGLRHDGVFLCYPDVQGVPGDWAEKLPKMPEEERFGAISMGSWSFCALRQNGTPTCWYWDIVADGWVRPEEEPDVGELVSISTGAFHSCGLRATGEVVCWRTFGQEGPGSLPPEHARFVVIISEEFYSCGVEADGSRHCWTPFPVD